MLYKATLSLHFGEELYRSNHRRQCTTTEGLIENAVKVVELPAHLHPTPGLRLRFQLGQYTTNDFIVKEISYTLSGDDPGLLLDCLVDDLDNYKTGDQFLSLLREDGWQVYFSEYPGN